ncbi:hypothetical protein CHH28_02550 [Bacterioplanes sanyensis]|uniref:Lipoprotein n=1 Tax=Bacterioplanes sanyensis TaxID=1249553 RepID=A0A222FF29_9GAMM|nr:hypothetical protein [Bacterioplanes sanyensis]ASP37618.1 hypothetical protein CHH28_02550 [Bacterioplanes sanyensis]
MKNTILTAMILLLSGCSSLTYIPMDDYTSSLTKECLSMQSPQNEDAQEQCEHEAEYDTRIAERIYELRADKDLQRCRQQHTDEQAIDQCFQQAQTDFYDLYFRGQH